MPLTPYHLGILVFGIIFLNYLYIPALAISGTLMDIEPFYHIFIATSSTTQIHGFFHTFFGASIIAFFVGFLLIKLRKKIDILMTKFKLNQSKVKNSMIYLTSFIAAFSHIILDSIMHKDIRPFWPVSNYNPFLYMISINLLHNILILLLITFIIAYFFRLIRNKNFLK